jgi:hypothetical protein
VLFSRRVRSSATVKLEFARVHSVPPVDIGRHGCSMSVENLGTMAAAQPAKILPGRFLPCHVGLPQLAGGLATPHHSAATSKRNF